MIFAGILTTVRGANAAHKLTTTRGRGRILHQRSMRASAIMPPSECFWMWQCTWLGLGLGFGLGVGLG